VKGVVVLGLFAYHAGNQLGLVEMHGDQPRIPKERPRVLRLILLYGVPGALIFAAPLLWGMLSFDPAGGAMPETGAIIGYLTTLVALTGVLHGMKHYRDRVLGGFITFLPALGMGLAISAVASLGWVIAWEAALAVTKFDFGGVYSQMMLEEAQKSGASAEKLAQVAKDGQAFAEMYRNPLMRVPLTFIEMFPIGVVISLISAALLRNSRFLPAGALA
jgi:hypothetical protein